MMRVELARSSWLLVCSPWDGQRSLRAWLEVRFGVPKYADGKVLDMRGPLCCQLKELDVVPLHSINQDYRRRLEIKQVS